MMRQQRKPHAYARLLPNANIYQENSRFLEGLEQVQLGKVNPSDRCATPVEQRREGAHGLIREQHVRQPTLGKPLGVLVKSQPNQ